MRLTRVEIRDFRSIRHLVLDLGDTTVLIGPNNAGKSAILDALRLALTRPWGKTGASDGPSGTSVCVWAEESAPGDWPLDDRDDDVSTARSSPKRRSLALFVRFVRNTETGKVEPRRKLLEVLDVLPSERRFRPMNVDSYWRYLPVFYLGASRDIDEYWSSFPRFWEGLRAAEIPAGLEPVARGVLDRLSLRLKDADPDVEDVSRALAGVFDDMLVRQDWLPDVTKLPPPISGDLISSLLALSSGRSIPPWSPPEHRGQGMRSLSVFAMFLAFIRFILGELYTHESRPVLLVEEPETHLHPHAVRTLWRHVDAQPGQKIVATHSPYLVQSTSFRDLRRVRFTDNGTEVNSLPESFSVRVPPLDGMEGAVRRWKDIMSYDQATRTLTVAGSLRREAHRRLLRRFGSNEQRREFESVLRDLRHRSSRYIANDELRSLETFARRIRGEIFFAERWLIVEGQSDYLIGHGIADAMEFDLDGHRVSVIDAQNNGSATAFPRLARALGISWLAVLDGDNAGKKYKKKLLKFGFGAAEVERLCLTHSAGKLEAQLLADGLGPELREILTELGVREVSELTENELEDRLRKRKVAYAARLADRFRANPDLVLRAPKAFRTGIAVLVGIDGKTVLDGVDS